MTIELKINGVLQEVTIRPDEMLYDTLHDLHITSVRKGCDTSSCGICTVLVDDRPMASCSTLTAKVAGRSVTTVEGISQEAERLAQLFGDYGADQCGFCNPGMALAVYAMKLEGIEAKEEAIAHYMVGNLCRCSGYVAQHAAIKAYLEVSEG